MSNYRKIGCFKNTIKAVREHAKFHEMIELPIVRFTGRVKLHGTNSSIVYHIPSNTVQCRSKNNSISPKNDNAGFATFVSNVQGCVDNLFDEIMDTVCEMTCDRYVRAAEMETVTIYGEWCGGNVQKGVALNQLEKMFVIFGIKFSTAKEPEDYVWVDMNDFAHIENPHMQIHNICKFPSFVIDIDFNNPQMSQNRLIELTEAVEAECPVGKFFDVSGIGEGIVWSDNTSNHMFKVKGAKHSVTKVKKLAEVDTEKLNSIAEFVDATVTVNRLNQGIDYLNEMFIDINEKNTGDFIRWIVKDIREEESDMMEKSRLIAKDVNKSISTKARLWFMNRPL